MRSRSDDDPLDLMHQVMHRVRLRQRHVLQDDAALTPMDARVLRYFGRHPGGTLKDLAAHSGRDKAQLARLIKGLRDGGWLRAEADADDRRNQCLWLTPSGEALYARLETAMREVSQRAAQGLTAPERQQLAALLVRVRDNLTP